MHYHCFRRSFQVESDVQESQSPKMFLMFIVDQRGGKQEMAKLLS